MYGIRSNNEWIILHEEVTPNRIHEVGADLDEGDPINSGLCVYCGGVACCEPDEVGGECTCCHERGVFSLYELHERIMRVEVQVI